MPRLKVNIAKLELVLVGNVHNLSSFANTLACKISSFLMKYLGLSLGASFRANTIWDEVEKIECGLANWKRLFVSKGGRTTLFKCMLSNLPTHFLSLFTILVRGNPN